MKVAVHVRALSIMIVSGDELPLQSPVHAVNMTADVPWAVSTTVVPAS